MICETIAQQAFAGTFIAWMAWNHWLARG